MVLNPDRSFSTLEAYLRDLGSLAPAPGGGSAAAYTLALGLALAEKVCRLTLRRPVNPAAPAVLSTVLGELERLSGAGLALMAADESAYQGYADALALPKTTTEEVALRKAAIASATVASAEVPLGLIRLCVESRPHCDVAARLGNAVLRSDAEMAGILAYAAAESALLFVTANLSGRTDHQSIAMVSDAMSRMEEMKRLVRQAGQ